MKGDVLKGERRRIIAQIREEERQKIVKVLKKIEAEKWRDATHCTCLGYAISQITGEDL